MREPLPRKLKIECQDESKIVRKPVVETQVYHVPRRFGMSGIMALITLLAVVFGLLRILDPSPTTYLYFMIVIVATGFAQMQFTHSPRIASVHAGMISCTVISISLYIYGKKRWPDYIDYVVGSDYIDFVSGLWIRFVYSSALGIFFGYLCGSLNAFCFLLMDKLGAVFFSRKPAVVVDSERPTAHPLDEKNNHDS